MVLFDWYSLYHKSRTIEASAFFHKKAHVIINAYLHRNTCGFQSRVVQHDACLPGQLVRFLKGNTDISEKFLENRGRHVPVQWPRAMELVIINNRDERAAPDI